MGLFDRQTVGPIGLDVGATSVRAVQLLWSGGRPRLLAAAERPLPALAGLTAEEAMEARVEAVRKTLAAAPFKGRKVVVALGLDQVDIRPMSVPSASAEELDEAVGREAEHLFSYNPDQSVLDYSDVEEVRDGRDRKVKVLAVIASRERVDQTLAWIADAGLRCAALDVLPFAVARLAARVTGGEDGEPVAVVDFGATHASGMILLGGELVSTRNIPLGGEYLTRALMDALELDRSKAEALKCSRERDFRLQVAEDDEDDGEEMRVNAEQALRDILWPKLDPLSQELNKLRSYSSAEMRGAIPLRVIAVGGGAYLEHLPEFVRANASMDVELHELGELLDGGLPPETTQVGGVFAKGTLRFAAAMGLALREAA